MNPETNRKNSAIETCNESLTLDGLDIWTKNPVTFVFSRCFLIWGLLRLQVASRKVKISQIKLVDYYAPN